MDSSVSPLRILLIDHNPHFAVTLRNNLEIEGFAVEVASDPEDALNLAATLQPSLVILEVMLPGAVGFDLLQAVRDQLADTPILVLTAGHEESEKLRAFGLGADDFVTKPVAVAELMARIRAVLRRTPTAGVQAMHWIRLGEVEIHPPTRSVRRGGVRVSLRPKEFDLLLALLRHRGRVLSRSELLRDVWGYQADTVSRTVDTHMGTLRQKLEIDPLHPRFLVTVRAAGYMLRWPGAE